jgi:hypothetical protein
MANSRPLRKIPITWDVDGYSQAIDTSDFRDIGITIVGTGDVQVLGTKEAYPQIDKPVNFKITSTINNSWATVVVADETTPNTYVTTFSVTAATKLGEVNTNLLTFISLSRSINTVDAFITYCDNS